MHRMKFTILVWKDYEGLFTAKAVDCPGAAAMDNTVSAAVEQVKRYIAYLYREEPWRLEPDFLDPSLREVKVDLRPGYKTEQRTYPCGRLFQLTAASLLGRRRSGGMVCALPTLDISFGYHENDSVDVLIREHVKRKLDGLPHSTIAYHLKPSSFQVREAIVRSKKPSFSESPPALPQLNAIAEPLGDRSVRRRFLPAWEREEELTDLKQRLSQKRSSLLLLGPRGVGKSTLLVNAVRQLERRKDAISEEDEPLYNVRHRHWLTSGARIISGMRYLGQWQERCEEVIEELDDIRGVLCVESLFDLISATGGDATSGVAAFLVPYLERGELRLVAEATDEEFAACRRLLPDLADVLQVVKVPEFDSDKSVAVLKQLAEVREKEVKVSWDDFTIETTYSLFRRFMPYETFPGKTVPFLREQFERARRNKRPALSAPDIVEGFVRQTGLPEEFLRDEMVMRHDDARREFETQVFGQPEASLAAANLVTTFKAGLNDSTRPVGVLLFCGPTGVGKTEMAKAIAKRFFGAADRMIRLDMSEYAGYAAAERLIIGPDGKPSELVRRIRDQPFSLVLLDEIEKAADDVFDTLLSVFDEGRLTDRYGRTSYFRSAVVIMTSNLGAQRQSPIGYDNSDEGTYEREVQSFFRPEFFNRIDQMVTFRRLESPQIRSIAEKELGDLAQREGLLKTGVRLTWTPAVVELIVDKGFDTRYGARPLQRTLERLVVTPLARWLVENAGIRAGTLTLDVAEESTLRVEHQM